MQVTIIAMNTAEMQSTSKNDEHWNHKCNTRHVLCIYHSSCDSTKDQFSIPMHAWNCSFSFVSDFGGTPLFMRWSIAKIWRSINCCHFLHKYMAHSICLPQNHRPPFVSVGLIQFNAIKIFSPTIQKRNIYSHLTRSNLLAYVSRFAMRSISYNM